MQSRMAFSVMALLVAAGCNGPDSTAPVRHERGPQVTPASTSATASEANDAEGNQRSGALHVTKECSQYTRLAGSFCTLTSSNLRALPPGTKVVYLSDLVGTTLETDVILYPPGNGSSVAFGHVSLDLVRAYGIGTLSGGSGRFKHLEGTFEITPQPGVRTWAWTGRYSFGENGDND